LVNLTSSVRRSKACLEEGEDALMVAAEAYDDDQPLAQTSAIGKRTRSKAETYHDELGDGLADDRATLRSVGKNSKSAPGLKVPEVKIACKQSVEVEPESDETDVRRREPESVDQQQLLLTKLGGELGVGCLRVEERSKR
jgi:hypothetical protein